MSLWTYWSKTKLEDAVACMRRLFYVYCEGVPRKMTVPLAAGMFVHNGCKRFSDPEQERPRFTSAAAYAGRRVGVWKQFVAKPKEYAHRPLSEEVEGERYMAVETTIRPSSERFYEMFVDREKPLAVERRFLVRIGDFIIDGAFDAIDKGLCYIDYKTSALKKEEREGHVIVKPLRDHELHHDYQFTIYSAVLPLLAAHDTPLAERLCLTEGERKTLKSDPLRLMEAVVGKRVDLTRGTPHDIRRTPHDLIELLNTIEACAIRAEQGDFSHSRGYHCNRCLVKEKCDEDWKQGRVILPHDAVVRGTGYVLFPPRRELRVYTEVPRNIAILDRRTWKRQKKREEDYPLFRSVG